MSEWSAQRLCDFLEINPPTPLKKGTIAIKVGMEHLSPNSKKIREWDVSAYNGGAKFCNGDTLLARITPCLENGKIGFVNILGEDETAFGSTEFLVFRKKAGISDSQFIFYFAFWNEFRDLAVQLMTGTSGRQRIETDALKIREFVLPDIATQKAIAEVLSSLDDKIDLLTRQNVTLEDLAQTYFRQWFIENPNEYWIEKGLDDIADFLNGLALQNYPYKTGKPMLVIKIKELNNGFSDSSDLCSPVIPAKYIVHMGDVIFSWSGSLTVEIWKWGEGALNQHLFKVTSNEFPKWFYFYWIKHHLTGFRAIAESKATTMGHIQRGHLTEARVLVPSKLEIEEMSKILAPLIEKIERNNAQIMILQKLRDTLLPKLISGEVRVKQ